jgi:hypothetical protein
MSGLNPPPILGGVRGGMASTGMLIGISNSTPEIYTAQKVIPSTRLTGEGMIYLPQYFFKRLFLKFKACLAGIFNSILYSNSFVHFPIDHRN